MKKNKIILSVILIISNLISVNAQVADTTHSWKINSDAYFYFLPDGFLFLPVISADKEKLHLEARYNYENKNTFSGWAGYNISGGKKIEYTITPMAGMVLGNTKGIAPGIEATINYKKFEFYTEAEYLFDFKSIDASYFYNWADLTYSLKDWLWFGLSGQRLRTYNSPLDYQRGFKIGGGGDNWEINGYIFNIDTDSPFYVAGISLRY